MFVHLPIFNSSSLDSQGTHNPFWLLASFPHIDMNRPSQEFGSPLHFLCIKGPHRREPLPSLMKLLRDPRVRADILMIGDRTPLMWTIKDESEEAVSLLIASGKDLAIHMKDMNNQDALDIAHRHESSTITSWLEDYIANPAMMTMRMRHETGWAELHAAELYALVIFLCDGLLALPTSTSAENAGATSAMRFFRIATCLPMELQTILCRRAASCAGDLIPKAKSEEAFRFLTEKLIWDQEWKQ